MKCPMCGYERGPTDEAPAWQCPSCKVAYLKAAAAAVSSRAEPLANKMVAPAEPIPVSDAASRRERTQQDREKIAADVREWQAVRGQKILIYCILLNLLL